MATGTSWQLTFLTPLLIPLRAHISQVLSWQSPQFIDRHTRPLIDKSHHLLTHQQVQIDPLPDGSELIYQYTQPPNLKNKLLLYFHGGAFLAGSPQAVRPITTNLVVRTENLSCYSVKYPLQMSIPKVIEVGYSVYRRLLIEGWSPEQIVIGGDSAGGHLALQIAFRLIEKGEVDLLPNALLLLSPWLDLTGELAIDDSLIHGEAVRRASEMVLNSGDRKGEEDERRGEEDERRGEEDERRGEVEDRLIIKLQDHEQISELPSIFLQYGQSEIVSVENRLFASRAQTIEIDEIPKVFHGFHYFAQYLPESDQALDRASRFLSKI